MSTSTPVRSAATPPGPGTMRRRPSSADLIVQVAKREISTKLRDRAYLISMAVFVAIIVAVIVFNVLANRGSDDYKVAVVGEVSQEFEQAVQAQAGQSDITVEFVKVDDRAAGEAMLKDDADAVLDGDTLIRDGALPGTLGGVLQSAHQTTGMIEQAQAAGIDPGQLAQVMKVEPLQEQSLSTSSGDELQRGIVAMVSVGLAYGMLMMIIQFVAQGVVEEKSSRVVELLMTTVKPRQLLAGKVLGLGLLGFLQLLVVVGIGVAAAIFGDLIDIPASGWSTILQVLGWFVLGYAFFATLAAAAGSLVSRQEDLGSALMPLTFVPMIAFFLGFRVLTTPDDALSTVLSMVPGISPTTMPVRAAMTSVPLWQYLIAILLQVLAVYLLVRVAARVYSGALLKTSGKLKVKEAIARSKDESTI